MENDINKSIYQQMIDYAHKLVDEGRIKIKLDGSFTTAEMARNYIIGECKVKETIWEVADESLNAEGATISAGNFTCHFLPDKIFELAYAFQSEAKIGRKDYEHFSKQTEEEPIICEFTVPKDIGTLVKATANDELRPQLCGVYLDTDRRCLVASDGGVLRAVSLPDLNMWQPLPKKKYTEHSGEEPLNIILNRKLIKPGAHITVTATKADDGKQWENNIEGRYPRWSSVFPTVGNNNCINIKGCMKEIQKAVKALTKAVGFSQKVVLSGEQGSKELRISMTDELDPAARQEKVVMLPEPCNFKFVTAYLPDSLAQMSDADHFYFIDNTRIAVFAKDGLIQLLCPRNLYERGTTAEAAVSYHVEPIRPFNPLGHYGFSKMETTTNEPPKQKKETVPITASSEETPVQPEVASTEPTEIVSLHYAHMLFLFFQLRQQKKQAA